MFEIFLLGLAVGFVGGMFGKGGSAIATPLLQLMGVPGFYAVASPLPATIPGTLIAAFAYYRTGLFDKRLVFWGIVAGFPATIAGSLLSRWFGGHNLLLLSDILLFFLGFTYLVPEKWKRKKDPNAIPTPFSPKKILVLNVCIAIFVGLISGLLANAGGFLLAPLYNKILRLPLKAAFSCSLLVASALAIPGTLTHMWLGHIDWMIVLVFGLGSVPFSYLGARTAIRMPIAHLEPLFGMLLTGIGLWGMTELLR